MKKLIIILLIILTAGVFAIDWFPGKEKVTDLKQKEISGKDTTWYSYIPDIAYTWTVKAERSTFFNVHDFGLEYPVNLHAITAFLDDEGYAYTYRIYDADGVTLLFEASVDSSLADYNDYFFNTPIVIKNDFWISVIPQISSGLPRLVSSDVTTSDHSYFKTDGVWTPFLTETERYEWVIYAGMQPVTGPDDPFPPYIENISGSEWFMNTDASVSITVHDQSAINSLYGQYDLGAGWVNFPMTLSAKEKTAYIYTGSIPGQPDGTTATVRFYMEDEFANSAYSDEYSYSWSKDAPILYESFEGAFPPAGWSLVTEPAMEGFVASTEALGARVKTGQHALVHWDESGWQDNWIWTPEVYLPAENSCLFSFWQNGLWVTYAMLHEVVISTDGGATYTQIYEGIPATLPDDPDNGVWEQLIFWLKTYSGQNVMLGFHYQGDYSDQWFIDDVKIKCDYIPPVPNSLIGNEGLYNTTGIIGEYLNNPLNLKLTISDQSGIASVTGHYSFEGEPFTDLVFSKAKGTETWTGTIPERSIESVGTIFFDMVDIGGVSGTSGDFEIQFVKDGVPPIPPTVTGTETFINNPMNLTFTFYVESVIDSCVGHYSKDDWVSQYDFVMTPVKYNEYTYVGTIPAETEQVTNGKVNFTIYDSEGNSGTTWDYTVKWFDGQVELFDDFDSNHNPANWVFPTGSTWGFEVITDAYSPVTALSDSPGGNYIEGKTNIVETKIMDLSSVVSASISFWAKVDLEEGWDFCYLEGTYDNGATWINIVEFNGGALPWQYYSVGAGIFVGNSEVKFRFRTVTDAYVNQDGIYIDDIKINTYNNTQDDNPIIVHEGPEMYGGVLSEHKSYAVVYDFDGVDSVWVEYSVDYSDTYLTVNAIYTDSNRWEFTIPPYEAGTRIDYLIRARDSSEVHYESSTGIYSYIIGYWLNYTNGPEYIDYLDIIGSSEGPGADAVAVKLTMGPMDKPDTDTYKADLIGFTIANYISEDYPSDPLYAHVWENDGGKLGIDMIPPIWMVQASTLTDPYALTYVDLMPYQDVLSNIEGDVFVGFTSAGTRTNILYEVVANHTSEPGYVDFNRSWLGQLVGENIEWTFDDLDNYCITGIIGPYTWVGIEDDNLPKVTELKQNYPNPFNPVTTIRFDLAKDSKVSLIVYDVMGREVMNLVDKDIVRGVHNITFDASRFVSGVYYYTLKAGEKNQTRKMMLIK